MKVKTQAEFRKRRHLRLRKKVVGTAARPRMSVFVSNRHLYVQFIDDAAARTVAAANTLLPDVKTSARAGVAAAEKLGRLAAQAAKGKGIAEVVFDRGGFAYRGRIKALADAARAEGLQF